MCNHVRCAPEPSDTVNPFGQTLKTRPTGSRARRQCTRLQRAVVVLLFRRHRRPANAIRTIMRMIDGGDTHCHITIIIIIIVYPTPPPYRYSSSRYLRLLYRIKRRETLRKIVIIYYYYYYLFFSFKDTRSIRRPNGNDRRLTEPMILYVRGGAGE